jgi:four helix bundle protein
LEATTSQFLQSSERHCRNSKQLTVAGFLPSAPVVFSEQLRARSRQFALDVIDLCLKLDNEPVGNLIRPQLLRSGTGVASNYRAASRGRSDREFVAKLGVVIEEADESELWLDVLETKRRGPAEVVSRLRVEAGELRAIFSASRSTALANLPKRRRV